MKGAVLCNGPSRVSYVPSDEYQFVLGCNVPWTEVDATVVLDIALISIWDEQRGLIKCPVYFSKASWEHVQQLDADFYSKFFVGDVVSEKHYHSSGHTAVEIMIQKGFTEIDVYGCDAYFDKTKTDSFTRDFIKIESPNQALRAVDKMIGWKVRWTTLLQRHPNVKIKFIR